ncbi:putative transposase for the IS285 insertion element [Yersinia pestis]|nr:putative transposase for the IS285 insertion element [Yersinia pestis]
MDEKKLKALAAELAKGLKTEADLNAFSRMLTKLTVETALNAELTEHLGHEKNPLNQARIPATAIVQNTAMRRRRNRAEYATRPRNTFEPQLIRKIRRVSHRWTARFCPCTPKA